MIEDTIQLANDRLLRQGARRMLWSWRKGFSGVLELITFCRFEDGWTRHYYLNYHSRKRNRYQSRMRRTEQRALQTFYAAHYNVCHCQPTGFTGE